MHAAGRSIAVFAFLLLKSVEVIFLCSISLSSILYKIIANCHEVVGQCLLITRIVIQLFFISVHIDVRHHLISCKSNRAMKVLIKSLYIILLCAQMCTPCVCVSERLIFFAYFGQNWRDRLTSKAG